MSLTKVPPERQKILGLVKGKLPPDQERMSVLTINLRMMLSLTFSQLRPTNRREIIHANRNTRRRRDQGSFKLPHYLSTFGACINMWSELEFLPDVINDLDVDFADNPAAAATYKNDQRNIRKVKEATEKLHINIIHPLREGKRLLVLDIDYSKIHYLSPCLCRVNLYIAILDTKPLTSGSLPPAECARPGLHEFLETIYPFYDICIW